jgi:hypothetical protein
MISEVDLDGVYIAPFAAYLFLTVLIFIPLRFAMDHWQVHKYVWHRSLFDLSVFAIILCLIGFTF